MVILIYFLSVLTPAKYLVKMEFLYDFRRSRRMAGLWGCRKDGNICCLSEFIREGEREREIVGIRMVDGQRLILKKEKKDF